MRCYEVRAELEAERGGEHAAKPNALTSHEVKEARPAESWLPRRATIYLQHGRASTSNLSSLRRYVKYCKKLHRWLWRWMLR